ncbi:MAG: CARDB domain-containing protein [Thermoplasmatota archaeon]
MRTATTRTFVIVFVLVAASFIILNMDASAYWDGKNEIRQSKDIYFPDVEGLYPLGGDDEGYSNDLKHITPSIENIEIFSVVEKRIFPHTPVDFVIETKGPSPEMVRLFLDRDQPSLNITYDIAKGTVYLSDDAVPLVTVDLERTSIRYNSSSKYWEVLFALSFEWSFPKDIQKDVEVLIMDPYGNFDNEVVENAYMFEPDIQIEGTPTLTVDDPSSLTEDHFIRGGEDILIKQLSVHFEGYPEVSPDPFDITVGVQDSFGMFWEYSPSSREQMGVVSFSVPMPRIDGPDVFEFIVRDHPSGSKVYGKAAFSLNIDSTSPTLGDFRYRYADGNLYMSWALIEEGSGLDTQSMQYAILASGNWIVPWTEIPPSSIIDGRLKIEIGDMQLDDLDIKVDIADRVGNDLPSDQTYHVASSILPAHDISIDGLSYTPEVPIINQLITFFASVHNHGTEDEGKVQAEVLCNGVVLTYIEIDLPAGSTREIRWTWKAAVGTTEFQVLLDPQGMVPDEYTSDNSLHFIMEPDYLDVTAQEDYMVISDPDAENMQIITITYLIRSIGGIESGPIKVIFMEDGKFMGMHQITSIYKEGSRELVVEWKVDRSVRNLSLMVDPYNEILESVEDNNLIVYLNPFFLPPDTPVDEVPDPEGIVPLPDEEEKSDEIKDDETPSGGTTWKGIEIPEDVQDEQVPPSTLPVVVSPTPEDPEVIPSYMIPTAGFILTSSLFGLSLLGLRSEVLRFKLLGLLIPLYSKLKKSKIEKGTRHEILGYLKAKPGANYSELKRNLDLNDGSLVHHLRVLEREEKIYSKKMGKYKLFYVSSYRRQASIRDYISPFQLRILEIILQNPGIIPNKLSKILDRTQTDMSYHLGELSRNGLLEKRKKGRNIHYYISEEYSDILTI